MNDVVTNSSRRAPATQIHALLRMMAAAAWRHRFVHAAAAATFVLALVVGARTGNRPDIGTIASFAFDLFLVLSLAGGFVALYRLYILGVRQHEPSPTRALARMLGAFLFDRARIANSLNGLAAMIVFAAGFSVLKGAIAILAPFHWDEAFAAWDRALHFGRAPHEWLWWLIDQPVAVWLINLGYNFWFVVLTGSMLVAAISGRDTRLRHQFMTSLILVWVLAGFFVATAFSSAGPCYFARLGLGAEFQPLMDALAAANERYPVWALTTQDILWSGYSGAPTGSVGISAFPSVHVATAVLIAIYATRRSLSAGVALWLFAALIMIGSVVLGWHYAIDGYAGAILAAAIWKASGIFLDWFGGRDLVEA
ncbi:MAG: phosphatase PAP2 family protein [Rhizobiaceae bacterium]